MEKQKTKTEKRKKSSTPKIFSFLFHKKRFENKFLQYKKNLNLKKIWMKK